MTFITFLYLFAGAGSLFSIGAAFYAYNITRKMALLKGHDAMTTEASVTNKEKVTGRKNDVSYIAVCQFHTDRGEVIESKLHQSLTDWKETEIGDTISLRYLRNDPKTYALPGQIDFNIKMNRLLMCAMIAAAILLPFCVFLEDYFGALD